MVVIRLAPGGRKNQRIFGVCVADKDARLTGRYIERIGQYNEELKTFELNKERYEHWLKVGAQPSQRVESLKKMSEAGTLGTGVSKKVKLRQKKAERAKAEAAKAAAEEAAAASAEGGEESPAAES